MQNLRWLTAILLITVTLTIPGCSLFRGRTAPIPAENSVFVLKSIPLGGMEQWIQVRGEDRGNPVLLWLHGGPGSSQMPIAQAYNSHLEQDFIVVHWDQRGAGKSNPRDFTESSMTIDQFIQDAHQLTLYLKQEYNKDKIYLAGHSWGTQFGILLAQAYPEDYHAYIGISQVVDPLRNGELAWPWLEEQVQASGKAKDLQALQELGGPPFVEHMRYVSFAKMIEAYGGGTDISFGKLAQAALSAPEYTIGDYLAWFKGANRGSGPMWEETLDYNLIKDVPCLELPVYFLMGAKDHNTNPQLVQEYLQNLDAPMGKELILFDGAAHTPFLVQPEQFRQVMLRIKHETLP